jgi:HK97 family phage prohead protease
MDIERRAVTEIRWTGGRTLYGVAAPFDRPADIGGMFTETIARGAFTATLAKHSDILALANHRSDQLLGRTRSGTLRLSETAAGLEYSLELPATSVGDDVLALAQRGDLGGMSIGFVADAESWSEMNSRQPSRTLRAVSLHEVSVISGHPAYDGTSIALRARARQHVDPKLVALQALVRRL